MINGTANSAPKGAEALPSTYHPVTTSLDSLPQLTPQDKLFIAARCFVVALGLLLVTFHFFKDSALWHSPIEWFDMSAFNHAKLAADFRPFDANISGSVYQEGLAAVSIPADSPPAVALPAESAPAVSLPADSPQAGSLPAESPPAVSIPAESPSAKPLPPEGDSPLVAFDRAFATLVSFQQKGRFSFANIATFNVDPSVTSSASVATRYKLLSLPVSRVPENLTQPTRRVCYSATLVGSLRVGRYSTGAKHKEIQEESRRGLKEAGWTVKEIERIRNPHALNGTYNEWNYSKPRLWQQTDKLRLWQQMDKLRLWQQTEYTKLLFIDSDLLLLNSIDFLFSYPEISARGNDGTDFNSGVMVLEPSDCMFELLMANLERVLSENGGDQVRPCSYVM
ncbi:unnamed protein product [Closterium sp. Naga37s-1]|nr:unnamed protein product [Closterium sp. Naga37s-1]